MTVFSLPALGTAGALYQTRENLQDAVRAADAHLQDQIDALSAGIRIVGEWSAASGAFPTTRPGGGAIQAGDAWIVSTGGTVNSVAFAALDRLVSLGTGGVTYAGNWLKAAYSDTLDEIGAAPVTATGTTTARTLAAHLGDVFHVKDFGAVGDGVTDDAAALQAAFNAGGKLVFESGATYRVSANLTIGSDCAITTTGAERAIIATDTNSGSAIQIVGADTPVSTTLAANVRVNDKSLTVADATGIEPGMLLFLKSNKAWYHDQRTASMSPSTDATGTAQAGGAGTITLKAETTFTGFTGLSVTIETGTGAGQARTVSAYDNATKVATVSPNWKTQPDSTSFYRFPALFKGEVHKVAKVTGNVVEIEAQTFDGYDVVDDTYGDNLEAVTVTAFPPVTAHIENIHIVRPLTLDANSNGFFLQRGMDCVFRNCRADFGQASGIQARDSYSTLVESCEAAGANDTTTGYGVVSYSSYDTRVLRSRFFGCRRGVDFTGFSPPSRHGLVEDCDVFGGGLQEDGSAYGPAGGVPNFGFGSHGGADGIIYRNNRIGNVDRGIFMRGRNEQVINNTFIGNFTTCIDLAFSANIRIRGNKYMNQFANGRESANRLETNSFEALNIRNFQARYFVRIQRQYQWGDTEITDNVCHDLNQYFIYLAHTEDANIPDLLIKDNFARIIPNKNDLECALIGRADGSHILRNSVIDNNIVLGSDATTTLRTLGAGISIVSANDTVNQLNGPKTFCIRLSTDTATKFRSPYRSPRLLLAVTSLSAVGNVFFGVLTQDVAGLVSFGVQTGVSGRATAPTGTSGTPGEVTLHYDGDFIHVENRAANARQLFITVFPAE